MTGRNFTFWFLVMFAGCGPSFAWGPENTSSLPRGANVRSNQPFSAFHRVDALLTKLDRDNRELRSQLDQAAALRSPRQQKIILRKLRRSPAGREAAQTSGSLVTLARKEEELYAKRKQRYGQLMFRQLHRRAIAMNDALIRERNQSTMRGFADQENKFGARLLAFVLQFQAISAGYGALACDPGGWTCCQPRMVKADGKTEMRGCTWQCTAKTKACRGGCLGPRIPGIAVAIQTNKPKLPSTTAHPASKSAIAE